MARNFIIEDQRHCEDQLLMANYNVGNFNDTSLRTMSALLSVVEKGKPNTPTDFLGVPIAQAGLLTIVCIKNLMLIWLLC